MTNDDRKKIVKKNETRTDEIAEMIDEGGMGADKYYKIKKKNADGTPVDKDETTSNKNDEK